MAFRVGKTGAGGDFKQLTTRPQNLGPRRRRPGLDSMAQALFSFRVDKINSGLRPADGFLGVFSSCNPASSQAAGLPGDKAGAVTATQL